MRNSFDALLDSNSRLEKDVRILSNWVDALMVQLEEHPEQRDVVQALANNVNDNMQAVNADARELTGRVRLHMGAHHPPE